MDTDRFIYQMETEDFYEDIANYVKKWFDTSGYSEDDKRPLPKGINKKVIDLFKDELGGKIMIKFVALTPKTYSYLIVLITQSRCLTKFYTFFHDEMSK